MAKKLFSKTVELMHTEIVVILDDNLIMTIQFNNPTPSPPASCTPRISCITIFFRRPDERTFVRFAPFCFRMLEKNNLSRSSERAPDNDYVFVVVVVFSQPKRAYILCCRVGFCIRVLYIIIIG